MSLRQYVFPEICGFCKKNKSIDDRYLCQECLDLIIYTPEKRCPQCSAQLDTVLDLCHQCIEEKRPWRVGESPLIFKGQSREIIHHFKYNSQIVLCRFLAQSMHQQWLQQNYETPEVITYVPMHWFKEWRRGYNQAKVLAEQISQLMNIPLKPLILRRNWRQAQALMSRKQRQENIRHIFKFNEKENMPNGTILIIDDVLTTGATLTACCKALLNSGAKDICILTAARG